MKKLLIPIIILTMLLGQTAFAATSTVYVDSEDAIQDGYAYTLDGIEFRLPTSVAELENAGWTLNCVTDEIEGMTYVGPRIDDVTLQKEDALIEISVLNNTEEVKPAADCTVARMDIRSDRVRDPEEKRMAATRRFSLINGTKVGDTIGEVLDNYGLTFHIIPAGEKVRFEDYFTGESSSYGDKEHSTYILLKDGKKYGSNGNWEKIGDDLSFKYKLKKSLDIPSMSSKDVGDNYLDIYFDRPLNDAEARVVRIDMGVWM